MKIVSVATMRELDAGAMASGVSEEDLMRRAGTGGCTEALAYLERWLDQRHRRSFTVLAGRGNNGGDAYVVAAELVRRTGLAVRVLAVCAADGLRGAARRFAESLPAEVECRVVDDLHDDALRPGTVVVDGLLGTGGSGALRSPYDRLVAKVNAAELPVVALDVPSGLDADSGEGWQNAVVADLTVTMGLPKRGLLTPEGMRCTGALRCVDIGIPPELVAAAPGCGEAITRQDAVFALARRPRDAHKNTFGHVLVLGGSRPYTGAPLLAGAAGLRAGAGMATVAVPASVRPWLQDGMRALILQGIADGDTGCFGPQGIERIGQLLERVHAVVVGPGIGRRPGTTAVLATVLAGPLPVVVDADALHLLAGSPELVRRQGATVLTPHAGEMQALLQGFGLGSFAKRDRVAQARAVAAQTGTVVALKGPGTVVAERDQRWAVNTSGSSALATAGTGDVLAGLIGGLLAQGGDPWDAVRLGVFLHGRCGECPAGGGRAMVADDLVDGLGLVWRDLTPFS